MHALARVWARLEEGLIAFLLAAMTLVTCIGAEDLDHFGIRQWHIGLIVPVGFALVFIRFAEILVRILRNRQTGLGLADEAADALKLTEHEEPKA